MVVHACNPQVRRLRQDNDEFEVSLGCTLRTYLKKRKKEKRKRARLMSVKEPVAHICNPSYLGGRDHEDCGSRPALANTY
jgi:hypothetical protein